MPRKYGEGLLLHLNRLDENNLGARLAKVCIEARLPAIHVAKVFGVSRMAVHAWFRGGEIRSTRRSLVESFISVVQKDIREQRLPAVNIADAKAYLAAFVPG
jgi:hypothetical protein